MCSNITPPQPSILTTRIMAKTDVRLCRIEPPASPSNTDDYTIYEFTPGILLRVRVSAAHEVLDERIIFSLSAFTDWQLVMTLSEFKFVISNHGLSGGRFGNIQTSKDGKGGLMITYVDATFLPQFYPAIVINLPERSHYVLRLKTRKMLANVHNFLPFIQTHTPDTPRIEIEDKELLKRILFACTREYYKRSYTYFATTFVSSADKEINLALCYLKDNAYHAANWCLKSRGYSETSYSYNDIIEDGDKTYSSMLNILDEDFVDPVAYWFVRGDTVTWRKLC